MKKKAVSVVLALALLAFMVQGLAGCAEKQAAAPAALKKVIIANYGGAICYAPLYVAYENGFFKDEGLDAELLQTDFEGTKNGLATGKIDAALGLFHKWIKPVEQGMDIKFTAGLHSGCIQVVAGNNTGINTAADLKGKRIGVDAVGGGPMNFLVVALNKEGIDWQKEVTWRAYPPDQLETALDKGEIDALAITDPFGQTVIEHNKGHMVISQALTEPFSGNYCCLVAASGKLIKDDPQTAAAITRALMKSALWVNDHKAEAARLEVEKKWTGGTIEGNAKLLEAYRYAPSVQAAQQDLLQGIKDLEAAGLISVGDPEAFVSKIFVPVTEDIKL